MHMPSSSISYTPPEGAVLINRKDEDAGRFDWDAVNNDEDIELCLIRVPEAVKPKHLENMTIDMPSSSRTSCIGTLKRKYMTYDLWALGGRDSQNPVGGDEIKEISCLLPRKKKKGRLYLAPKPIARHLILSAQSVKPTPVTDDSIFKIPSRPSYPKELLKHRFMPYGSLTKDAAEENSPMDADGHPSHVLPLKHSSMSQQHNVRGKRLESPEIEKVQPKKIKKRKAPDVEITDNPVAKKNKKTKAVS